MTETIESRVQRRFRSRGRFLVIRAGHMEEEEPVDAILRNVSPSGMGLDVPCEFAAGEAVHLVCNDIDLCDAVVQHSHPHGDRFAIGIAIVQELPAGCPDCLTRAAEGGFSPPEICPRC